MILSELPADIFLEYILTQIDVSSLLTLSSVSDHFYALVNDEYVWRKLCFRDFNLSPDNAFRQTGWKRLYRLLLNPKVYVWGENFDSRLGLDEDNDNEFVPTNSMFHTVVRNPRGRRVHHQNRHGHQIAIPEELRFLQDKSIIDIVSGGWSFHALDKFGYIWCWGSMQQDLTPRQSLGTKRIRKPQKLGLPDPNIRFSSVSSGRRHAIGLCKDGSVYHWSNCERIQKVDLPTLEVAQVSANWEHSSILTKDGQIFSIPRPDFIIPSRVDEEVPPTVVNPELGVRLQSLLVDGAVFENAPEVDDMFVQIAGISGYTIALTKDGRVVKLSTEDSNSFSTHPTQHAIELARFGSKGSNKFVAGNHHSFGVCTSDGKVLLGHVDSQRDTPPTTFDEFNGHKVCKMSFGDYHCGAITTEGKLFTWGKCDSKALGHGFDVNSLDKPKIVESLNEKFVFAIGFGGWQSSVLAIDLNE